MIKEIFLQMIIINGWFPA